MRTCLVFVWAAGTGCFGQSAEQILAKVAETYRDAKSLRLELTQKHKETGGARGTVQETLLSRKFNVSLALERPDKLRLSIRGLEYRELWSYIELLDSGPARGEFVVSGKWKKSNYLAVADGNTLWTSLVDRHQYTQRPVNRSHTGEMHSTMDLLIGRYRKLDAPHVARIVKHEKLKRSGRSVPCVVIETLGHQYWVDEQRYLVLLERVSNGDTLTWSVAELDPTFPPATFTFKPPKNAKQVASLATPQPKLQ
jgi:outer membrane lipoprotein-sorting protein